MIHIFIVFLNHFASYFMPLLTLMCQVANKTNTQVKKFANSSTVGWDVGAILSVVARYYFSCQKIYFPKSLVMTIFLFYNYFFLGKCAHTTKGV